jgi:ribosome maturation factor RimP
MTNSSTGRQLCALLTPAVEQIGVDLEDVEVVSAGKRRVVRLLVDKDGGVSLDDVAAVSQAVSALLDATPAADAVVGSAAYVLEVSSPGVDRPLVRPRQWRRAAGRLARVSLKSGGEITGRILHADADGVRLAPATGGAQRNLRFDELGPGRVQVEFRRPGEADAEADAEAADARVRAEEPE